MSYGIGEPDRSDANTNSIVVRGAFGRLDTPERDVSFFKMSRSASCSRGIYTGNADCE
jgi:hypothetical protein